MTSTVTVQEQAATLAIVHHANQFIITDGYENRMGISSIVGTTGGSTGLTRVLDLHERYRVPLNLHISGTLLESLAWHCPSFLSKVRSLANAGILELIGGSYGQNMMRFFSREHNFRQLSEELLLYNNFLGWEPGKVTTFWTTERLWDTENLAPIVTDSRLPNGGYRRVILDDRLLYSSSGSPSPRQLYDYQPRWDPLSFNSYRIKNGNGLHALPISFHLRQNIPPKTDENLGRVKAQLNWLLDINAHFNNRLIAIYADDMEKSAGVGWDPNGPSQFEKLLKWVSESSLVQTVKLNEWSSSHTVTGEKSIDPGSYRELVNEFEAGENYDNWYHDDKWAPYRHYHNWSEARVLDLESQGADPGLIDLAWKILLATAWQTAWHTPQTGAHGERNSDRGPSPWVKAIASHSRLAAIVAEAAHWMLEKDDLCHTLLQDIDQDGNDELILKNNSLFAVFTPRNGGRLVYLFTVRAPPGRLVVGNPIDDWNLLEGLHEYMDVPPNHPGALSDVGCEHANYSPEIIARDGDAASAKLVNIEENSPGYWVEKNLTLRSNETAIRVDYKLPSSLTRLSTEVGFSPDYLQLLRKGNHSVKKYSPTENVRGWANKHVTVGVRLDGESAFWDMPRQEKFGHGYLLRVTGIGNFTVWTGAED